MKIVYSLFLIGLFLVSVSAQKGNEVELVLNGIKYGTTYEKLVEKLGKPIKQSSAQKDECIGGYTKTVNYSGLEIVISSDENGKNYTVFDIAATSSKWSTREGIRLGSTITQVKSKYGQATESNEKGMKVLTYEMKNGPGAVYFYFRNSQLVKFELIPTAC